MLQVKVARVPGKIVEVALEEGDATVKKALETAGISDYSNASLTIEERTVGLNDEIADGDTLLVANRSVKGA